MQLSAEPYGNPQAVAHATVDERASFIVKTYVHLVGAVFAFVFLEAAFFITGVAQMVAEFVLEGPLSGRFGWLLVLGAFIAVSFIADRWARSDTSSAMQYMGLGLYVVAEAVIFIPLLFLAAYYSSPDVIPTAGLVTLVLFGGLTGVVFLTRKDFSFLKGILGVLAIGAIGFIIAGAIFGFNLGLIFSWAMVALACGYILYHTSQIMLYYRTDQHVAASLALFADVMLLLWYVIQILMARGRR
ncbi:MAG: permease [Deltaproteobacteria bacterium]|nr:permease [Deltaproteobacteria bacterium]